MYIEHMQLQNKRMKQMKMAEGLRQLREQEELEALRLERLRERAEREKHRAKKEKEGLGWKQLRGKLPAAVRLAKAAGKRQDKYKEARSATKAVSFLKMVARRRSYNSPDAKPPSRALDASLEPSKKRSRAAALHGGIPRRTVTMTLPDDKLAEQR